jgi:uncharacterized protein YggU (UPF0235/DUF167 family)
MPRRKTELSVSEPTPASTCTSDCTPAASIHEDGTDALIALRVKPRAHSNSIGAEQDGAWSLSVRALASEGAANAAVVELVARTLGVAKSTCSLERGHKSRDKMVRVRNLSCESARERLRKASEN